MVNDNQSAARFLTPQLRPLQDARHAPGAIGGHGEPAALQAAIPGHHHGGLPRRLCAWSYAHFGAGYPMLMGDLLISRSPSVWPLTPQSALQGLWHCMQAGQNRSPASAAAQQRQARGGQEGGSSNSFVTKEHRAAGTGKPWGAWLAQRAWPGANASLEPRNTTHGSRSNARLTSSQR
jgi:hypothetical protein